MAHSPSEKKDEVVATDYLEGWAAIQQLMREGLSWSGNERHCCFLNTGSGRRFADISAISGLDFLDDGRGLAIADWDADGDLDFWVANRTGPQLRFLRNDLEHDNHFLAIKLVGSICNRDAIGARVELELTGDGQRRLVRTLYAGHGYLGQSSKWLHFGIEKGHQIKQLSVRWPGGETETYSALDLDTRYELKQGGSPQRIAGVKRSVNLKPTKLVEPADETGRRITLSALDVAFYAEYEDYERSRQRVHSLQGQPLLVTMWATWCAPCLREISEFSERAEELKTAGINILAVNLDDIDAETRFDPHQAKQVLDERAFPFKSGLATTEMMTFVRSILRVNTDMGDSVPLPCSFLLDKESRVVHIYNGSVSVDQILEDARVLETAGASMDYEKLALPFDGTWVTRSARPQKPPSTNPQLVILAMIAGVLLVIGFFAYIIYRPRRDLNQHDA